jgi:glycosyltransferase involved in cell wall biosynthesis
MGEGTRVLFLYTTLAVGGSERQLAHLVPALSARGFAPEVATLRHRGRHYDELLAAGIPTTFVDMRSRTDIPGLVRGYRLWRRRPHIVFTSSVDAQVIGQAVAARAGARHVTAEHGGMGIPRSLHRRLLTRFVAPRVDRVIAVSATQVEELAALGYSRERITVIPNGTPRPSPDRSRQEVRAELGLESDDVVALFLATLRPEKRVELFVEGVLQARRQEPRLRAVVAGGGAGLEALRRLASATPEAVLVLGERSDVADLLEASDLLCVTSSFEGLPMSVLEAMALGRPVVAMRVGGLVEVVNDGRTGRLVPPGDVEAFARALVEIAREPPAVRRALGEAARADFERGYTLERMVDRYAELLEGLSG